jgi:Ca-activated chloride channel homolog
MMRMKFFGVITLVFLFLSSSLGLVAQTKEDDEVIKVDVPLVNIPFSVADRDGRSILGLTSQNFTLFEDGKPQKIEYLSTQDTPLNIVLLLDTSQSAEDIFAKIRNAASEFIKQLRPKDRAMIVSFDEAARVKCEFTNNQIVLDKAIKRTVLSIRPGTLMRDTISVVVEKELKKVKGRKAIILITDGKDAGSSISKVALLYRLAESEAPVYTIFYETVLAPRTISPNNSKEPSKNQPLQYSQKQISQYQADQRKKNLESADFLDKIANVTGGRSYRKEINNLGEAFNNIAEELRKQYLVSFYPTEENYALSKHQIKIKVDKVNAIVKMKNQSLVNNSLR